MQNHQATNSPSRQLLSHTYILVPQLRTRADEVGHHANAPFVLDDVDADAAPAQQVFVAHERAVLADDDVRDTVQQDGAGTHRTGRERGVHDALAVDARRLTAGALERVHLPVQHRAQLLDAPIVPAPDDDPSVHEDRANGNPSFGQAELRFRNRRQEKGVHVAKIVPHLWRSRLPAPDRRYTDRRSLNCLTPSNPSVAGTRPAHARHGGMKRTTDTMGISGARDL